MLGLSRLCVYYMLPPKHIWLILILASGSNATVYNPKTIFGPRFVRRNIRPMKATENKQTNDTLWLLLGQQCSHACVFIFRRNWARGHFSAPGPCMPLWGQWKKRVSIPLQHHRDFWRKTALTCQSTRPAQSRKVANNATTTKKSVRQNTNYYYCVHHERIAWNHTPSAVCSCNYSDHATNAYFLCWFATLFYRRSQSAGASPKSSEFVRMTDTKLLSNWRVVPQAELDSILCNSRIYTISEKMDGEGLPMLRARSEKPFRFRKYTARFAHTECRDLVSTGCNTFPPSGV